MFSIHQNQKNVVVLAKNNHNYSVLEASLNYTFRDKSLLQKALSHRSVGAENNERLEFLGDSILNFTAAEALFHKFPTAPEGDLSRLRALLVKGETLAEIAKELNLSDFLILGEGEMKSGGYRRSSILADSVEAIIGAIYLEASIDEAKRVILGFFDRRLDDLNLTECDKDPKSQLQEWLQARKKPLPSYTVTEISGESHCQEFTVSCETVVVDQVVAATASNRRQAEKLAASLMLELLRGKC